MANRDHLRKDLFLERLENWRADPSEENCELLVNEHLRPMTTAIISKAIWLTREDQDTAIAEALWRMVKSLGKYDPAIGAPFHFFSRIAYNERMRIFSIVKRDDCLSSIDEKLFDDEDSSTQLDRLASTSCGIDELAFSELWRKIPAMSEPHQAVFESVVYGNGAFGKKRSRLLIGVVCRETGLPEWAVRGIVVEVKALLNPAGCTVPVDELLLIASRIRRLQRDDCGTWTEPADSLSVD